MPPGPVLHEDDAGIELYWLPLGAGDASRSVRLSGRVYEALAARRDDRPARQLYHSALEVRLGADRFVIEMVPAWGSPRAERGVVGHGPVGLAQLGRSRFFRYEVRRWRNGCIPDLSWAVGEAQHPDSDVRRVQRLLELVPAFPTATWGRDELRTGDMWNSNSLISWLLARSGHDTDLLRPPLLGRAPGWNAGLLVAARHAGTVSTSGRRTSPARAR